MKNYECNLGCTYCFGSRDKQGNLSPSKLEFPKEMVEFKKDELYQAIQVYKEQIEGSKVMMILKMN